MNSGKMKKYLCFAALLTAFAVAAEVKKDLSYYEESVPQDAELDGDELHNYKAKTEFYVRQHQDKHPVIVC